MTMASGDACSEVKSELDVEEFELIKRLPSKWLKQKNDVYISNKTNFQAQKKRCQKLLQSGHSEIFLHGLGAAVERTVNLALQLKMEREPLLEVSATTDTLRLTDELECFRDKDKNETYTRNCSVIHIRIFKNDCFVNNVDTKDMSDAYSVLKRK